MDDDAFDAFDAQPAPVAQQPPERLPSSPHAAREAAGEAESAAAAASRGFGHLQHECIASISYHGIEDEARARIEQALRDSVVHKGAAVGGAGPAVGDPRMVHYFQSFVADYVGASSAAAAAVASRPQYDLLVDEPLPHRPQEGGGRGNGRGGRGRGGRGGRSRGGGGFNGRYYDAEVASRPGELSAELRALLGMRDGEPPPYLVRM